MTTAKALAILASGALGLAGMAGGARASEVFYDATSGGTVTFVATDLTNPSVTITLSPNVLSLATGSASVVGFDATGLSLDSFLFSTSGTITISSPTAYAGTTIDFSSLTLQNSGTAAATSLGGGNYQFTNASSTAAGTYSVNGGASKSMSGAASALSGTVGLGSTPDTLGLSGIAIGDFTVGGQTVNLSADIAFNGAQVVPLPPAAWLFTSGLGLLGLPFLRRRIRTLA
jgi:hypothetical protein